SCEIWLRIRQRRTVLQARERGGAGGAARRTGLRVVVDRRTRRRADGLQVVVSVFTGRQDAGRRTRADPRPTRVAHLCRRADDDVAARPRPIYPAPPPPRD